MSKFDELVTKLREIFQIDRPELDFGIYRILNARSGEINDYLQNRLREKVKAALASGGAANLQQLKNELAEGEKQAAALGVDPAALPKLNKIRDDIAAYGAGGQEYENQVFSHLLTFFSRYYDQGDFISQRRYKGDTYAIPYAGEEVMLHWANKDQYYTKSGEAFSNFTFKLDDGRSVHFRLTAADTAKDNRKDNDKDRRYCLLEQRIVTKLDEEGDEYEEELIPIELIPAVFDEDSKQVLKPAQLIIRFEYKAVKKGTKQDGLVDDAVGNILKNAEVKANWSELKKLAPTEKDNKRTLLEKHLINYTTKNSADYFIHKDLGGFLRRELDFYIKNEVMHLDDVQNAEKFSDIEKSLRMIQCLRSIAQDLIGFVAALEDFQKKLWLKKKFVVSADYCITLDRIPEDLYEEIAANERQWDQWRALAVWDKKKNGSTKDLKLAKYRLVDTSLFPLEIKYKLVAAQNAIDENLNGLLVSGDNFNGLNLLNRRYERKLKCIYIDPPYNAKTSEILYKNTFKNSAWATFISNRLDASRSFLKEDSVYVIAIDENEQERLGLILSEKFSSYEKTAVTVVHNPRGIQGVDFHAKLTQGFHPKLTHPWLSKFSYCFVDKSFISVLGSPVLWVLVFVRRVRGAAELCLKRQESLPVSTIWQ